MEDKIIVAVCGKPELYDSTNYFYRDKYRKDLAWRRTDGQAFSSGDAAPVVGVPEADSSPNAGQQIFELGPG
ncbi:hypothetical protein CRENBAI_018060 [Crenichthys baileyi]|uniref:Uncharacterized protein n=1 Tax=Crenichthys baileyi TaxID=28760 RepID=A0AAV9RQS9_9TELE